MLLAGKQSRLDALPRWIARSTALLLLAGIVPLTTWWRTGDLRWIDAYFHYPGALFLIGCSLLFTWLSYECWSKFSPGDLLRPAWLLILLSGAVQAVGGVITHVFGRPSHVNPLHYLPAQRGQELIRQASEIGRGLSPLYMIFLAIALFYVLRACRRNGILGRLKSIDLALLAIVLGYTVYFLIAVVFPEKQEPISWGRAIGWTSDPLLCVLLFEAILIRRSIANMGWGLISRCWLSFTVALFLTSLGDICLWMSMKGYFPAPIDALSWYIWFLPSAAYVLGPAYQLQAMVHAIDTASAGRSALPEMVASET